jgi:hypothetical protein
MSEIGILRPLPILHTGGHTTVGPLNAPAVRWKLFPKWLENLSGWKTAPSQHGVAARAVG